MASSPQLLRLGRQRDEIIMYSGNDAWTINLGFTQSSLVKVDSLNLTAALGDRCVQLVFWNEQTRDWDSRAMGEYLPKRALPQALALATGSVIEFGGEDATGIDRYFLQIAVLRARQGWSADREDWDRLQAEIDRLTTQRAEERAQLVADLSVETDPV